MESNCIKRTVCENVKRDLKGILSDDEIKLFDSTFYDVAKKYVFKEKRN